MRDAWLVPLINCGTSFLAGIVVFSILGYMAHITGQGVEEVVQGGTGLAFVVYPEALAAMPGAPIFSVRPLPMLPLRPTTCSLLLTTHHVLPRSQELVITHYSLR